MIPGRGQQVLVTGAGGFVGSHLAGHLVDAGYRVRCFVRYTSTARYGWLEDLVPEVRGAIEIVAGDLRDAEAVRRAAEGVEAIFHLGALVGIPYSYVHPREVIETNVGGTLNVLMAARDRQVKVIYASTSEVYGSARSVPMDEDHGLRAQSPYAASKIGAETLVASFSASYGLPSVIVRPFNMYGPRQSARAVIPTIIAQALTAPEVRLGETSTTRDFTYVTDTVDAFLRAARVERAVGEIFNVGSGNEISIGELAGCIARLIGKDGWTVVREDVRIRPGGSEVRRLVADATRAREVLGWRPTVSLEHGLGRTISWMEANLGRYRSGGYQI